MSSKQKFFLITKMNKTFNILNKELEGLRTNRASIHLLDPVIIEAYGNKVPLAQTSTISTPDAKTITIEVWDKALVKNVEKAISSMNLGLNPKSDGQLIKINIPLLSEERRQKLVKVAHKYGENTKIVLRNIRRTHIDNLKKMQKQNLISKDEQHRNAIETQKVTNEYIVKIDNKIKQKSKEIMEIT
jgi:ribosome recycling factor